MKRVISVIAGLCLVLGVAGNAAAAFTYGSQSSLCLSIYNPSTGVETGYDLGVGVDLTQEYVDFGLTTTVNVGDTDATVALFSANSMYQQFFGITADVATGVSTSTLTQFQSSVQGIFNIAYMNGASPVTISTTEPKSANGLFSNFGSYQGFVSGGNPDLQPNLNALATDAYMDIYLYEYDVNMSTGAVELNKGFDQTTDYAAALRIASDGSLTLHSNVSAIPVPAAIWLLGPGLIGLIGIRQRRAKS